MKLKIFLASLFILLVFVGYKTYRDTAALKSIDSYESCTMAKGSIIQTSYPATCVTRLGSRFTQPLRSFATALKTYTNEKYHFTINYPNTFILETEDLGSAWPHAIVLLSRPNSQSYELVIESWDTELDYRTKYLFYLQDGLVHVEKSNNQFLTLVNFNSDKEVSEIIASFKFTN